MKVAGAYLFVAGVAVCASLFVSTFFSLHYRGAYSTEHAKVMSAARHEREFFHPVPPKIGEARSVAEYPQYNLSITCITTGSSVAKDGSRVKLGGSDLPRPGDVYRKVCVAREYRAPSADSGLSG